MTPAVILLQRRGVAHKLHHYSHDPTYHSYGLEAAEKLGVATDRVFKTLLVTGGNSRTMVALVPVSGNLDLKKLAQVSDTKKLAMAEPAVAERLTGYQVGGISPLGQKRLLPTIIDSSSERFEAIFISGGRRGLEIEIAPPALVGLLNGRLGEIARY